MRRSARSTRSVLIHSLYVTFNRALSAFAVRILGTMRYTDAVMIELQTTQTVPLELTDDGVIRVAGSRVTLDSVVHHFKLGATAEEIAQKFPSLRLVDVYAAITYYLGHREAVESYLQARDKDAAELRRVIEANQDTSGIRERLLARLPSR